MRHQQISSQTFKIITQYGDMLVVKQTVHRNQNYSTSTQSTNNIGQHQQYQKQHGHHMNHSHHHHHHHQGGGSQSSGEHQSGPNRPILMTFHDLGMNSELQFATFCECDEVKLMLQTFTLVHVNFIGQEFDAQGQPVCSLPDDFKYPTVEQMAECIVDICAQLRIRSFIGLAVGAGAHIVSTLALIRPDLVHGLFLINPVISSCSITEWLYFKMSAIASNHQILGGTSSGNRTGGSQQHLAHLGASSNTSSMSSGLAASSDMSSDGAEYHNQNQNHHHHHSSGFKKLWKAMNHHHHHHHHHHHEGGHSSPATGGGEVSRTEPDACASELRTDDPTVAPLDQQQQQQQVRANSSFSQQPTGGGGGKPLASSSSSRLRQLILSRNFKLGRHHSDRVPAHRSQAASSLSNLTSDNIQQQSERNLEQNLPLNETPATDERDSKSSPARGSLLENRQETLTRRRTSCGSQSSSTKSTGAHQVCSNKRPPLEYLMYHHFGTASLQRFRRMSSDMHLGGGSGSAQASLLKNVETYSTTSGGAGADEPSPLKELSRIELAGQKQHRASCDSTASGQSGGSGVGLQRGGGGGGGAHGSSARGSRDNDSNQSQDSLSGARTAVVARSSSRRLQRSNSVCLSASYLASFSSDRQRTAYMQNVYRHYFTQLNAHNLWLFAQSFVKRRTLNLRKDCGAAAHAAAAAAALGTSICTAFVGVGAVSSFVAANVEHSPSEFSGGGSGAQSECLARRAELPPVGKLEHQTSGERNQTQFSSLGGGGGGDTTKGQLSSRIEQNPAPGSATPATCSTNKDCQRALVAGTKVKRTFTCQTLIMCSSVHIHRERALKLMSLLNPLQATWIKTDQLLVLEEKPEKVCQALRLFLQGIGYSMSTYERRLRLSSAQASISSADSNGSARSLNLDAVSSSLQQSTANVAVSSASSQSVESASRRQSQQQHKQMST